MRLRILLAGCHGAANNRLAALAKSDTVLLPDGLETRTGAAVAVRSSATAEDLPTEAS